MRLSPSQINAIRQATRALAGGSARVWLFGSRVRDDAKGGDVDLMLDMDTPVAEPAQLAARLSAQVARAMYGRRVDVLVRAPNLQALPIHSVALTEGVML
jgi:uncharacterized protein